MRDHFKNYLMEYVVFFTLLFSIIGIIYINHYNPLSEQEKSVVKFLGDDYWIEKQGAVSYITFKGERETGAFHKFYVQEGIVYGELGAVKEIVKSEDKDFSLIGPSERMQTQLKERLEVLDLLGKGYSFYRSGACYKLTFNENDVAKSYHHFFVKDGKVFGKLGNLEELVIINK